MAGFDDLNDLQLTNEELGVLYPGETPPSEEAPTMVEPPPLDGSRPEEAIEGAPEEGALELDEDGEPVPQGAHVPTGVLLREREKRQRVQAERDQLLQEKQAIAERIARWEARQEIEAEQRAAAERQAMIEQQRANALPPPPDPNEDPDAFRDWKILALERELGLMRGLAEQGVGAIANQHKAQETQEIVSQARSLQSDFKMATPDFDQAWDHLVKSHVAELTELGAKSQEQLVAGINQRRAMLVESCVVRDAQGRFSHFAENPAEKAYRMAQQRGYTPAGRGNGAAAPAAHAGHQHQNGNGAVHVPVGERMAAARAGQATAVGSTGAPGVAGRRVGMPELSKMNDAQFDEMMTKNRGFVDALMGRE